MGSPYEDGLDDFDRQLLGRPPLLAPQSFVSNTRQPNYFPTPVLSHSSTPLDRFASGRESRLLPSPYLHSEAGHQPLPRSSAPGIRSGRTIHGHTPIDPFHDSHIITPQGQCSNRPVPVSGQYQSQPLASTYEQADLESSNNSSPTVRISARKQRAFPASQRLPQDAASSPSFRSSLQKHSAPINSSSTPIIHGIPLVNLRDALPEKFRAIFPFEMLNAVQSKCFPVIYNTNDNVVVAAPTGSGKTAILELAICKAVLDRGNENFKIVYQAPTKALCSEKARDWEKKFSHMNLKCAELTGDTSQAEMRRVGDASIIVTTPEKWDSITRKWQDHRRLLQLVELFLIDEVHILKDARGATLEAVVSRMKTIGANVRFIALSATVPNSDDIAVWLARNHSNQHLPAHRETFGEEFRPVKLQKFVYGFDNKGNDFIFDKVLDSKLPGLISKHAKQKPILIFCFTRKSCEATAKMLADFASGLPHGGHLWPLPSQQIPVNNRDLQETVRIGVAFHHAGLDVQDRTAIEKAFLTGQLGVICCTSTLAVGINLPCHTVILKGTVTFNNDKLEEYSDLEVMQMLGRAGRPQFDDSATAIILTRASNKERYQRMVSGQEILESRLHLNLIEHLNSEICLETIRDRASAKRWLGSSFLTVRLRRNPEYYRLAGSSSSALADDILEEICERDITQLQETELVTNQEPFQCTEYGRAMSKYMVEFSTMKLLLQIPRGVGMEALITILSQASEFRDYRIKPSERVLYREINQSPLIMYPVKEAVTETRHKIFLMVQMHLGAIQYPTNGDGANLRRQLMMEQKLVIERLSRLVRAVVDCKGHDRDSIGTRTALELARALAAGSWEGRPTQLTQIPNIGPVGMRKLASRDVRTVLQLADKQCEEIERLMSRQPPFGKQLKAQLDRFPRLKIDATIVGHRVQPTNEEPVSLNIKATIRYLNTGLPIWMNRVPTINFFAETSSGTLVFFWRGTVRRLESPEGVELKFSAGLKHPREHVVCHFTCEEIVGTIVSTTLQHGLPASLFPKRPVRQDVPKPAPVQKQTEQNEEVFGDDDIDDMDMIMAVDQVVARSISTQAQVWSDKADDFPSPDELIEMDNLEEDDGQPFGDDAADRHNDFVSVPDSEPVRLPNGKWKCKHLCSGGVLTRSGKPCSHRCCKEGLDKPRKPRQRQPRQSRDGETGKLDDQSAAAKRQLGGDQPSMPTKRQKVQATLDQVSIKQSAQSTPAVKTANVKGESSSTSLNDLDCIDLSFSDDDDDWFVSLDELIASKQAAKTPGQTSANVRPDRPKSAPTSRPATDQVVEGKEMSKSPLPPTQYQDDDLDDFDISFLDAATASHGEGPKDSNGVVMSKRESEDPISGANTTSLREVENQPYDSPGTFSSQNLGTDIKRKDPETPQGPNPNSLAKTEDSERIGAADKGIKKEDNEPAWVAEFDQDVIDMFRGYVTFV